MYDKRFYMFGGGLHVHCYSKLMTCEKDYPYWTGKTKVAVFSFGKKSTLVPNHYLPSYGITDVSPHWSSSLMSRTLSIDF